jgi:hypothetical protein
VLELGAGAVLVATVSATDNPEPTALTIGTGTAKRIDAVSAKRAADGIGYNDKDTFELTTGADTTELAIRADWTALAAGSPDLLMALVKNDLAQQNLARPAHVSPSAEIWPVEPATKYLLWVSASATGDLNKLPINYELSLCGGKAP